MKHVLNFNEFINEAKQHIDLFPTEEELKSGIDYLRKELDSLVPYLKINTASIGRDSMIIKIAFEPENKWINGYFENTNGCKFMVDTDGTVETITCSLYKKDTRPSKENRLDVKFRKATCKTIEEVSKKLVKFINEVKKEYK